MKADKDVAFTQIGYGCARVEMQRIKTMVPLKCPLFGDCRRHLAIDEIVD